MHERRLSLLDTDRSQKIDDPRKICPNGEAGRPVTDRLTIDFFRLEKDGTFLSFCFFPYLCCSPVPSKLEKCEAFVYSRNNNLSLTQLHDPYGVGKLSISGAKICIFSSMARKKKKSYSFRLDSLNENFPRSRWHIFFISFLPYLFRSSVPSIRTCGTCV